MSDLPNNETRAQILDAAEELFFKRGYKSVRLRDIAAAVGMQHASLYYYVPGGKTQLFVEVMERSFRRHEEGITEAIRNAGEDIADQMRAVAVWLASQPPVDIVRMSQADMPSIGEQEAERLMNMAFDAVRTPIAAALQRAKAAGTVDVSDADMAAMALVGLIESVHMIPEKYRSPELDRQIAHQMTDLLLKGFLAR